MNKFFAILLFTITYTTFYAQEGPLGSNPNRQDWQIMKFDAGSIIFPKGMEVQSARIANIMNYQNEQLDRSVGPLKKKIPIIIQNQTVIPNGNVTTEPYRSRFYATSFEGFDRLGTMDWFDVLTIHEYRHVQQFNNSRYGLTKLAKILFGDQGWEVGLFLSIPIWYFEGDAVVAETMFTKVGRGRTPHFTLQQRAMAHEGYDPNYTLASNTSFRQNIPNQYPRGFMMLTHLRNEKDNDVIKDILKDAASFKKIIFPFSRSMKEHTGWTTTDLYNESWTSSKELWKKQLDNTIFRPTTKVVGRNENVYTNYTYPFFYSKNKIIALKNSFDETSTIVSFNNGDVQTIAHPGIAIAPYLQYKNKKALWTELNYHPRRANESYSNIIHYDFRTNKKTKITKKGKYFSPTFGASTKDIYALHQSPMQISSLCKIDAAIDSVEMLYSFQAGDNAARLQANDQSLFYVLKRNSQVAIWKFDFATKKETQLTPWSGHVIDHLHLHEDHIYYMGGFTGIENIFRSPINGESSIEQLSSVPIGAFYPAVSKDGSTLVFTEHTYKGSVISKMDLTALNARKKIEFKFSEPVDMKWQDKTAAVTEGGNILDKIPTESFETKDYKGIFKGMRLHSWSLLPNGNDVELTLDSDNYIEDVSADLLVGAGRNRQYTEGRLAFGRLLPIVELTHRLQFENLSNIDQTRNETKLALEVPLRWHNGNFISTVKPYVALKNSHLQIEGEPNDEVFQGMDTEFAYSLLRQKAIQNLGPRFGFKTFLRFQQNYTAIKSDKFQANVTAYFPGLSKNHGLKLAVAHQQVNAESLTTFFDDFIYPRGFNNPDAKSFNKFSIDYTLPLLYPDVGIKGIMFLQRIRTNVFYDVGRGKYQNKRSTPYYESAGIDLIFDATFINIIPFGIGFRNSFLLTEDPSDPGRKYRPMITFDTEF